MSQRAERHPRSASEGDGSEATKQRVLAGAAKPATVVPRVFDPEHHCGARRKKVEGRCRHPKGFRTSHARSGNCWLHGGTSPTGITGAAHERARDAVAKLGVPVGTGDPFVLLSKAVSHAEGYLEATAQVVRDAQAEDTETPAKVGLEAAAELYEQAIRTAARTGKAAVDADVADRLATLDRLQAEAIVSVINAVLEGLPLDDAQREHGREIAGSKLRILSGGLAA